MERIEIGPAISSDLIRLAIGYNNALDQCTRTQGSNIDQVMEFFADPYGATSVRRGPPLTHLEGTDEFGLPT